MKFRIEVDTSSTPAQPSTSTSGSDSDHSPRWRIIEDAWDRAAKSTGEQRTRDLHWIGGALALYAAFTGESAEALRSKLQAERPLPVATETPVTGAPMVELRPGRSTAPPPRHPGAQRVVDEPSTP